MSEYSAPVELLLKAAAFRARVEPPAPQWTGAAFNTELFSTPGSDVSLQRHERDLPPTVSTAKLDGVAVLIGQLSGPPIRTAVQHAVRRYRNQATIARSWLGASEAPNLQLFLIGPAGALADPLWRQLAAEIEVDDRVCRKLVWLYGGKPTVEDAEQFLDRTFLAQPWPTPQAAPTLALDQMSNVALPEGWEQAADDPSLDSDALVQRLIAFEEGDAP
jgi:ABC-three component (ABC-3C) system Middle Component 1